MGFEIVINIQVSMRIIVERGCPMSMIKITVEEARKIGKKYEVMPCKITGTAFVQIRKKSSTFGKYEDISWEEFDIALKKRKLAIYKSERGNFLKIMRSGK